MYSAGFMKVWLGPNTHSVNGAADDDEDVSSREHVGLLFAGVAKDTAGAGWMC